MQVIDFERKGNVVRFYLGEKTEDWGWTNPNYKYDGGRDLETPSWLKPSDTYYGDDWDDRPYEHNAGQVYGEFIKGHKDIAFNFDDVILEPCDGEFSSRWSKEDMVCGEVPCLIIVPHQVIIDKKLEAWQIYEFNYAKGLNGVIEIYFGDTLDKLLYLEANLKRLG